MKNKFRFWDKKQKIKGFNAFICDNEILNFHPVCSTDPDLMRVSRCPQPQVIAMQFTGLKDKNGKEIYEGDIVNFENRIKGKLIGTITFEASAFIIGCNSLNDSYDLLIDYTNSERFCEDIEVIGNIYENPELMKR